MSSPVPHGPPVAQHPEIEDDPMNAGGEMEEDEGEGDNIRPGAVSDDSSEEPEEDEEEARKVREGFIVDEDDEDEGDDAEERRRKRKRRKRKHRERGVEEEEDLDEEDLELLAENTGGRVGRDRRLTRLRRGRDSESDPEASSSKRKIAAESSDDDLDASNIIGPREPQDIQNIWDDERAGGGRDEDEDMDMDDFIDDEDDDEEGAGAMAEEEREERRRERRRLEKERRKVLRSRPELSGIDPIAWDEIQDVFGDGHDYDWALNLEEEDGYQDETSKPEMKYQDVFEPSEIKARLLTEDDDLIRAQDIPERMQLATSTLSQNPTLSLPEPLTQEECVEAAAWVTPKLSGDKEKNFFHYNGKHHNLLSELVSAVTVALEYLLVQNLEVPYIWAHRRDYMTYFNMETRARVELLNLEDLWRVYALGQKYRSLCQRQKALQGTYERVGVTDEYYEEQIRSRLDTVEAVADATQWLGMKYKAKKKDNFELHFHDDADLGPDAEAKKRKMPSRTSAYEVAKKSIVSKLADGYGIKTHEVVMNFVTSGRNLHFIDDQELSPLAFAEQFADPDPSKALPGEELLSQARMILSTELGTDPLLRQEIRKYFKRSALISVSVTDRGRSKIDEYHPYNNFKYLLNKPISAMLTSTQFLNMLAAESELLITIHITIPSEERQRFQNQLNEAFTSDSFSNTVKAWNEERSYVVQDAMEKHLLPVGVKWAREYIREEAEDYLADHIREVFHVKINAAPFTTPDLRTGEPASVLAISWGKGDPKKDEISLVLLDDAGRLREHMQLENLHDNDPSQEFLQLVQRRKPDVIVLGGFSIHTTKLASQIKSLLGGKSTADTDGATGGWGEEQRNEQAINVPVVYIQDAVARIFQHSKRAAEEFNSFPLTAKYCVGLARYAQSPLNEFAALGSDLTAITFDQESQHLIPKEKLLLSLERALVDVVNKVGVDVNRAINEPYYAHVLPYVAGLGPRKAHALVKKISSMGGTLVNREQLVNSGILTTRIFLNAAGFLRITQDPEYREPKNRTATTDYSNSPDPLDDTRIHVEDYELARKMATDALELDEEDIHDEHPSHVVSQLMKDEDNVRKLDELNLDDFAISMYTTNNDRKRHTLNVIRRELLSPFAEDRKPFVLPEPWEVVTMLTGETKRTLRTGLIVSVLVLRIKPNYIIVRLDSGIEGIINSQYLADDPNVNNDAVVNKNQTLPGIIIDVKIDLQKDQIMVELSSRPADVAAGDAIMRRVKPDEHWNEAEARKDLDLQMRKKQAGVNRTRRVIKHPNFHNFNSAQAEAYLEKQQAGDVVIRPSSKGLNHLAVTWKVADGLYQHLDVVEPNADPSGQNIGGQLIIDGKYEYSDLDEMIVNHVHAMARRVEELMAHEKFKKEDDELHAHLTSLLAANPSKSIYGFSLNRKRPGHFNLSFLAKKGSPIQTWPVRVSPEAYYLFDTPVSGVAELCDAFKMRHLHQSQNLGGVAGNKTPYGAGRMTPARTPGHRTPGHATPGHMSVRQVPRTPNPYSGTTPAPTAYPAATPVPFAQGAPWLGAPLQGYGFQTPAAYPPPPPGYPAQPPNAPPGMDPGRAAMLQQNAGGSSGWDGRW
ncbi:transcription elongation factor Spt6 [Rickenella mellea]|uniref:Transcription elongation factor Spt6 n=1 Tax=Rickenella mellea TaxID=50990 RepID=A0A4Y7QAQ5_9AGAM|nr:transcription elongation factor Spt6 [Rickenella mellea]